MTKPKIAANYTELTTELEAVMTRLESGDLGVDQVVINYERGITIIREIENYLKHAENRVSELKSQLDADEEE